MDTRPNKMAAIPIHAHVTCHWESFLAATIWYVRGSKTMYSPGFLLRMSNEVKNMVDLQVILSAL